MSKEMEQPAIRVASSRRTVMNPVLVMVVVMVPIMVLSLSCISKFRKRSDEGRISQSLRGPQATMNRHSPPHRIFILQGRIFSFSSSLRGRNDW